LYCIENTYSKYKPEAQASEPKKTYYKSRARTLGLLFVFLLTAFMSKCTFAVEPVAGDASVMKPATVAGPFTAAVDYAQRRCVKILGAGIGREPGYASGIIISADGQILTAQGIYLAGQRLRVVLPDGSEHLAKIERRSQSLQTALLKIDVATPEFFALTDKSPVQKGDWVLSLSNAFRIAAGREPLSVNLGIVSLRTELDAKRGTQDVPYQGDVLLIDAITSNPGAPGGALVTPSGELAGMIGKIIEGKSTNTRLNYAVPSDLLERFVSGKLLEPTTTDEVPMPQTAGEPGELGIRIFALGGKRSPAFVDRVLPGSPAAQAGIRPDDLVVSIGPTTIKDVAQYKSDSAELHAGVPVVLVIKRGNKLLEITLEPVKAE
jgi:serine protease Do